MNREKFRVKSVGAEWFQQNVACQYACPAHTDVPRYLALMAEGRFDEAHAVNQLANVFPAILGRICVRLCQYSCRRRLVDSALSICYLKRAAADYCGRPASVRSPRSWTTKPRPGRVAIVGAGPTGLTVAHDLAERGYAVIVFDALPVVGGMLRVGIPAYRLPRGVIDAVERELRGMGVQFYLSTPVGRELGLSQLRRSHSAVLIAAGAHKPEKLGIPGEDLEGVLHGVTFMRRVNLGEMVDLGRRVAVIGLGHTAIDCARSALRLGARQVCIVYRRTAAEAAVTEEEIVEATEEGVRFYYLASPLRILSEDGRRVSGVECVRNGLGSPDERGRRRPVPIPGSEFVLEVDTAIPAVSQAPDASFLPPESGLALSEWGRLRVDRDTFMTALPGVFAAGDFTTGPRDVIRVIADAHRAADSIDAYVQGTPSDRSVARFTVLDPYRRAGDYLRRPRQTMPTRSVDERWSLAGEVELGYAPETARKEAERCLQCQVNVMVDADRCILCGLCADACPTSVIRLVPLEALVAEADPVEVKTSPARGGALVLNEELCVRCGLCENRCPTGAISMVRFEVGLEARVAEGRPRPERTPDVAVPARSREEVSGGRWGDA